MRNVDRVYSIRSTRCHRDRGSTGREAVQVTTFQVVQRTRSPA